MSRQGTAIRNRPSRLLRWRNLIWVAAILLIWWAYKDIPWSEVWRLLSGLSLAQMAVLISVNLLIVLVFSSRLWVILRSKGIYVPLPRLISYWLIGFVTSYLIPGPQLSGAPVQVYLLHKNDDLELSEATAPVMTSKFLELVSSAAFMMFGVLAIFQSRLLPAGTSQLLIVFALGMLLFALGYLWATWRGSLPLTRLSEILPSFVRDWQPLQRFHDYIFSVEQQIGEFSRDKPLVLLLGLGISILSWTLVVVESWLAITFLGIQFSFIDAYIVVVVAQVAFLFPSPAGLGAVEAALVFAFPGLGYPASLGTALALLLRFQDVLVTTLGLSVGGWRFYKQDMQAKLDGDTQPAGNPVRDGKASEAGYGDDSQRNGQVRNDRLRQVYYDLTASVYDRELSLFSSWDGVDEAKERQLLASKLQISSNDRVLEIAIGTGSNIPYMIREGASNLSIFGIDFSRNMLLQCRQKLLSGAITTELVQSDAAWLPFPSNYFNAILHFGGFSNFSQQCQALEEMFRVARNGARIVIGDMSLANLRSPSIHQKILLKLRPEVSLPPPVYLLPARYIEDMSLYRFWGGAAYILKLVKPE